MFLNALQAYCLIFLIMTRIHVIITIITIILLVQTKSAYCNFDISSCFMFSGFDCLLWGKKKTLSLMCSHEQNMWYSLEILTCIHCDYCYVFIFLFLQKEKNWWFICLTGQMFFIQCCFPMHCRPTSKINK